MEFVNTSEAYSQIMFLGNDNMAIPYINICLMPHNPINNKQSFVDYSYYVLKGIKFMEYGSVIGKLIFNFDLSAPNLSSLTEYVMIGNTEVKIECQEIHYYLFDDSKISYRPNDFVPYETPHFKQTMHGEKIERFFSFQSIPNEIKVVLGDNISSILG